MDDSQQERHGRGIADKIINAFKDLLSINPEQISEVGKSIPIPVFAPSLLNEIAKRGLEHFASQSSLLLVPTPCYIIGDIHGNLFDLIRIFSYCRPPPESRFLFLGDYVDRGQYSLEVIALLFSMSIRYPDHLYLLRGNHEFERVNNVYGFKGEVEEFVGDLSVYDSFNQCFDYLSLVAKVGKSIFAVHGGISPQVTSFRQIERLKKPITAYEDNVCADLLWSDPTVASKEYLRSTRGNGMTFGSTAVKEFARAFNVQHIIRAHQCVRQGIEKFADGLLYTVFSCSNYQDGSGNCCGLIFVNQDETLETFSLPAIDQIDRSVVLTQEVRGIADELIVSNTLERTSTSVFDKSGFMSFFELPVNPTYMSQRKSNDLLSQFSSKERPRTAEPVRPVLKI